MCTVCPQTFKAIYGYQIHIVSDHFPIQSFPCEHCGLEFNHKSKLNYHIAKNHITEEKYFCDKCDAKFISYQKKQQHIYSGKNISELLLLD